jgi:hypothetical protein
MITFTVGNKHIALKKTFLRELGGMYSGGKMLA